MDPGRPWRPASFAGHGPEVKPQRPHRSGGKKKPAPSRAPVNRSPDKPDQKVYFRVSIIDQRETKRVGLLPESYTLSNCGRKLPLRSVGR